MKWNNPTVIGVCAGLLMVAVAAIAFYAFGMPANGDQEYVVLGLFALSIVVSLWMFAKTSSQQSSFKEFFQQGFKTFIIATLIMVVFTYIFYKLNPQILDQKMLENNELLRKEGGKMPMEIAENEKKLRQIFIPMMLSLTTIKFLIIGVLMSVIGSGFLSKKN